MWAQVNRYGIRQMLVLGIGILLLSCIPALTAFADTTLRPYVNGNILYIPIPSDVAKGDFLSPGDALKTRLYKLIAEEAALLQGEATDRDTMVVIFLDHAGAPILPDLKTAQSLRTSSGNAAARPAPELHFSFHSPDYAWTGREVAVLRKAAKAFYPAIKDVYGDPAFDITVNVRKDPTIPFSGTYIPSTNEILLRDASQLDVFCHEIIHAFRDDDMIRVSSYEEGMTIAVEVEVFNRLPDYTFWDERHSYPDDVFYEGLNNDVIGSFDGTFDYASPLLLLRYQLAGYAWGKVLLENPAFFPAFNRELYRRILDEPDLPETLPALFQIASELQPEVEGKPFATWYNQQGVFCSEPAEGSFLYQNTSNFVVYLFDRNYCGTEHMEPDTAINWAVFDYHDSLLAWGSELTSDLGWISFAPVIQPGYRGRIKMVVSTATACGEIANTAVRTFGDEEGVFGILTGDESGFIDIVPLDQPAAAVRVEVVNGAFSAPSLTSVKGRFVAVFTGDRGTRFSRQFNKDASSYFLFMAGGETTAALSVSQAVSSVSAATGGVIVYTVTITNAGPGLSTDMVLQDTLPEGTTFISATSSQGSCVGQAGKLTCALNSLPAGSTATVTVAARPFLQGSIANTVEITENGYDTDVTNNRVTANVRIITLEPLVLAVQR